MYVVTIKLGLNPFVMKTFSITPMNMHLEELTASETFVVFVLSIKKDGKNNNKSVILYMPILFNCDFILYSFIYYFLFIPQTGVIKVVVRPHASTYRAPLGSL